MLMFGDGQAGRNSGGKGRKGGHRHAGSISSEQTGKIRILRKANRIATLSIARGFSNEKHLIDARHNAGIALSELIYALEKRFPSQEKINKAKQAVEVWIEALR